MSPVYQLVMFTSTGTVDTIGHIYSNMIRFSSQLNTFDTVNHSESRLVVVGHCSVTGTGGRCQQSLPTVSRE